MARYGDPTHPNAPCFNFKARGVTTTLNRYPEFDSLGNGIGLHILLHVLQAIIFVCLAMGLYMEDLSEMGHLYILLASLHMWEAVEHYMSAELGKIHRGQAHGSFLIVVGALMFSHYQNTLGVPFFPYQACFYVSGCVGAFDMFATNKPWEDKNAPIQGPAAPAEKKNH